MVFSLVSFEGVVLPILCHTLDGSETRHPPVEVSSFSHCLQGFIYPPWCRISSINSMPLCLNMRGSELPFRRRKRFGEICWANSHSSSCTDVSPSNVDEVIIPRVSNLLGSLWFRVAMNDLENVRT